jgi:hypothetical protein
MREAAHDRLGKQKTGRKDDATRLKQVNPRTLTDRQTPVRYCSSAAIEAF